MERAASDSRAENFLCDSGAGQLVSACRPGQNRVRARFASPPFSGHRPPPEGPCASRLGGPGLAWAGPGLGGVPGPLQAGPGLGLARGPGDPQNRVRARSGGVPGPRSRLGWPGTGQGSRDPQNRVPGTPFPGRKRPKSDPPEGTCFGSLFGVPGPPPLKKSPKLAKSGSWALPYQRLIKLAAGKRDVFPYIY